MKSITLCEANPKVPNDGSEIGEAYVKVGHTKFVVTDDLRVLPHSLSSTLQIVTEAKIQTEKLVEKEITLTKSQVSSAATELASFFLVQNRSVFVLDYSLDLCDPDTWNRLWSYNYNELFLRVATLSAPCFCLPRRRI